MQLPHELPTLCSIYSRYLYEPNQNALPEGEQGSFMGGVQRLLAQLLAMRIRGVHGTPYSHNNVQTIKFLKVICSPRVRSNLEV